MNDEAHSNIVDHCSYNRIITTNKKVRMDMRTGANALAVPPSGFSQVNCEINRNLCFIRPGTMQTYVRISQPWILSL